MDCALYILYLDQQHADDLLFLRRLARALAQAPRALRCLVVHGGGLQVAQLLEAEGIFREETGGETHMASPAETALAERGIRELNRKITGMFTEEGVHAVGLHGVDRNLFIEENGVVRGGKTAWLWDLIARGVAPVMSSLVRHTASGAVRESSLVSVVRGMAESFGTANPTVVFFTTDDRPGLHAGGGVLATLAIGERRWQEKVAEPEAVCNLVDAGHPVLLTNIGGLTEHAGPEGTYLRD